MHNPQNLIILAGVLGLVVGILVGLKWRRQIKFAKAEYQAARLRGINQDFDSLERRIFGGTLRQER